MADIILPGAAYTEQNGYFTNLEGKLQKAYKASALLAIELASSMATNARTKAKGRGNGKEGKKGGAANATTERDV